MLARCGMTIEVATNTKRARRKERNRANVKARSSAVRNDRLKRYGLFLLVVAVVAAALVVAAIALPDPDAATVISHGG